MLPAVRKLRAFSARYVTPLLYGVPEPIRRGHSVQGTSRRLNSREPEKSFRDA